MSKQWNRQGRPTKQMLRRERKEERQRQDQARLTAKRKRNVILAVAAACMVIVGIVFGIRAVTSPPNSASTETNVQCNVNEQSIYHIHVHLTTYIDGQRVVLPKNVGITSTCIYWLHTHDTSGIIHIEAPKQDTFTLGTFLRFWRDQVYATQYPIELSSTTGWKVYVNGKPYSGDFNRIQLAAHTLVTLAYNSPNARPDTVFNWGQL